MNKYLESFDYKKLTFLFYLLMFLEFCLFYNFSNRNIINFIPGNFDQSAYLVKAYELYEKIQNHEWSFDIFRESMIPTSSIFIFQTVCFYIFFGASRFVSLFINFLGFIGFQAFGFYAIKKLTYSYRYSLLFLAFLFSISSPYFWVGGIFDFRIDCLVFSFFGIFLGSVLLSNNFKERTWTIISALIASYLINLRFLTAAYIFGIISIYFSFCLVGLLKKPRTSVELANDGLSKIKNIILFSCIVIIFCVPILLVYKDQLYNYYIVGHVLGNEKLIRINEQGITNLYDSMLFYPKSLVENHLGNDYFLLTKLLTEFLFCGLIVFKFFYRRLITLNVNKDIFVFLLIAFFVPLCILNFDQSKSPVVGSVLVPPILYLTIYIVFLFYDNFKTIPLLKHIELLFVIILFGFGLINNINSYLQSTNSQNFSSIDKMYEDISKNILQYREKPIVLGADHVLDFLHTNTIKAWIYEHKKYIAPLVPDSVFGGSIFAVDAEKALTNLNNIDVLILNSKKYAINSFPSDHMSEQLSSQLFAYARNHMKSIGNYNIRGEHLNVFIKPYVNIYGISGDWLTSSGMEISIPKIFVNDISNICMRGNYPIQWLTREPHFNISRTDHNNLLGVSYNFTIIKKSQYELCINFSGTNFNSKKDLNIKIIPDAFFIPTQLNINSDTRELVVYKPNEVLINTKGA